MQLKGKEPRRTNIANLMEQQGLSGVQFPVRRMLVNRDVGLAGLVRPKVNVDAHLGRSICFNRAGLNIPNMTRPVLPSKGQANLHHPNKVTE